jgi:hypothetical protein
LKEYCQGKNIDKNIGVRNSASVSISEPYRKSMGLSTRRKAPTIRRKEIKKSPSFEAGALMV